MATMKEYTEAEVAAHNTAESCWIIVDGAVFDMTSFLADHPGGRKVVLKVAGKDASKQFKMFHAESVLKRYAPRLQIGVVAGAGAASAGAAAASPSQSEIDVEVQAALENPRNYLVSPVPFSENDWLHGWESPYYSASHHRLRAAMRSFVEHHMMPFAFEWEENYKLPPGLPRKCFEAGWLPGVVGPRWPVEYVGDRIIAGLRPDEFDAFHELIILEELARCGSAGIGWGLCAGLNIGLPPILNFGSQYLKDKVAKKCLTGEAVICLAITEPSAGSDVANLKTTAVKTDDGKHYVVNGEKKWITNGVFADFFTVAVRTGGPGMGGVSLLLLERSMPGITTRQMKCSGAWSSGTTYITFEDVLVPVENLIYKENLGFKCIMLNFNHERWTTGLQAIRLARVCLEESLKYALKRETFGRKLIEHAVIRAKVANMARKIESAQAWLEKITYQMKVMPKKQQNARLGGPIALLKAHASQVFEYCAREAAQIFGGLAYTRGGQGEKVERLYREVRAYAIPAGSEEIMFDLGIRQALKTAKL